MKRPARRSLGILMSAALLSGLIPPDAARAAAPVRIELGAGLHSASPAVGVPAAAAATGALAPALSPTALPPSLSAPAAPLLAAPSAAPAAAEGPENAPSDAAKAAPASWLSRAASRFFGEAAPAKPADVADDAAKAQADRTFDGAAPTAAAAPAPAGFFGRARAAFHVHASAAVDHFRADRAVDHDAYGGPRRERLSFAGRVGYGLKWGANLAGIRALMDLVVTPVLSRLPWPLIFSPLKMAHYGRLELLTHFGPNEITNALIHGPARFLMIAVPESAGLEEFWYRFVGFGAAFGTLALAKPLSETISRFLEKIPDASHFRVEAQKLLHAAGAMAAYAAFPIAAGFSAFRFAGAHVAHWGMNPSLLATQFVAGYFLARTAYKTRGLTAPFVAHLVFNLAGLVPLWFGLAAGLPQTAVIASVMVSVLSGAALYFNWRDYGLARTVSAVKNLVAAAMIAATPVAAVTAVGVGAALLKTSMTYAVAGRGAAAAEDPTTATLAPVRPMTPAPAAAAHETQSDMIARVKPSVVQIIVEMPEGTATGSGVIVTGEGRVVTNAHVVGPKGVGEIVAVKIADNRIEKGLILAVNHDRDQAYLQLPPLTDGSAWPVSRFAKDAPREGDEVFAMGHPLGLPFSVTKGIISGLGSRGNMYVQYLQTDASINHGNSGGPLYNAKGEIIGINTMGVDASHNVGFSIVSESVVRALAQFDATSNINTAALGVIVDLSNPRQPDQGVAVEYVRPGSAASKAGLRAGDVVVGAGGVEIEEGGRDGAHALSAILARSKPGDAIEITVIRDDQKVSLTVALDAKKTSEETSGAHGFDGEDEAP